jgi:RNase P subunit RPR2
MRPPVKEKSSHGIEAPLKVKAGPLIRLPIKKSYCTKCQRLVKGQIQGSGRATQVICPKCSQSLWFWKSISWRSAGKGADASPE